MNIEILYNLIMKYAREAPEGAKFARKFSVVTRSLKRVPPANRLIVGNNNVPKGWQEVDMHASSISSWIDFIGDETARRLPIPRLFKKVGIMAVEKAEMAGLRDKYPDALGAVALRFQDAVVVGAFATGVMFEQGIEDDYELAGTRIGHDDQPATLGLWLPNGTFLPAETTEYRSNVATATVPTVIPVA